MASQSGETFSRPQLGCRERRFLGACHAFLRRHVLRGSYAAELAVFLAQTVEIREHFWEMLGGTV